MLPTEKYPVPGSGFMWSYSNGGPAVRVLLGSGSSSSSSTATAVVVEGVDGRSIGVQYVGTWDFDRNDGQRSIIRVQGRIIVAGGGDAVSYTHLTLPTIHLV